MHSHGEDPTNTQLADILGISEKQIRKADSYNHAVSSSTFTSEKGDSMQETDRNYFNIWVDYVYNDMDDKDKKIFERVSGYNNSAIKPKQDIAKELKMTPAAVSYRINNITSKLEEMPKDDIG
jgi:DNA-directed RNA polymerase specialized sigma subunit